MSVELKKIFVIIVTYNGKQWYDRCFSSLRTSELPIKTIVIDNASSDGTVDYVKTNYPDIILLESDKNLGFGQGNNKGIRYALDHGADYVFLLNQDAWIVEPDFFTKLIKVAENHKDFAIISPVQLYGSGKQLTDGIEQHLVDGQTESSDLISDLYFGRELNDLYEVPYVCAASWLISKEILTVIGGFDPIFFHYGEDDNYMQRVIFHGFRIGVCPNVCVCHDVEFREENYNSKHKNWKKNLLLEVTDINFHLEFVKVRSSYLKKSVAQFFYFKLNRSMYNFQVYKYLKEMSPLVKSSRLQNKIKQSNWL